MTLLIGHHRAVITPAHPVPLAGFASRAADGPANRVLSDLMLRVVVLQQGEVRLVIMVADLLWWGDDLVARISAEVEDWYGIPSDHLVLHATHNHSGPQPSERYAPLLGVPDPYYLDQLANTAVESVGLAFADLVPAQIETASVADDLGVDRRYARTAGDVPETDLDQRLSVIRLVSSDRPPVIMFHHACHPVVHHRNAITSEFSGAAMTSLEQSGSATQALYLQGCCGNINPPRYADALFADGGQAEVEAMGDRLADVARRLLAGDGWQQVPVDLAATTAIAELPTAAAPELPELHRIAESEDRMRADWAKLLIMNDDRRQQPTTIRLSAIRLGTGLGLVGVSAELVSQFGDRLRIASDGQALPLGYTNGMTGYLVTDQQLAEGGYEPAEAPYYFGMKGPLQPGSEAVVAQAMATAARSIWLGVDGQLPAE